MKIYARTNGFTFNILSGWPSRELRLNFSWSVWALKLHTNPDSQPRWGTMSEICKVQLNDVRFYGFAKDLHWLGQSFFLLLIQLKDSCNNDWQRWWSDTGRCREFVRGRDLANPSSVFSCHLQWAIFMESFEVFDTSQYAKAYWGQFTYTYMYERQKLPRDKTA